MTRFALGHDLGLHCSTWLLDFYVALLFVLCIKGVRFFPVQDQTDVVQLDPGFAYTYGNLNYNHTQNAKTKLQALV